VTGYLPTRLAVSDVPDCRDPDRPGNWDRLIFGRFLFARTARQSLLEG